MEFEIKIDQQVSIPPRKFGLSQRPKSTTRLALEALEPGQSFAYPHDAVSVSVMVADIKKKMGRQFTIRKIDHLTSRVWRTA